jgi:hypothetical protein
MATTPPVVPAGHVSWLKRFGHDVAVGFKYVIGVLGNPKVQAAEQQAAGIASMLLPAEAPLIQEFQVVVGKIFKQTAVTETAMTDVANASGSKLAAVVAEIGPELDQYVANNFPGSATVSAEVKAGLVNAIVAFQNAITVPAAPPPAT